MPSGSALGKLFFGAMQVTHYFLPEKTLAVFDDCFALDISGGKFGQCFFAQLLLAKSDVNCDEST